MLLLPWVVCAVVPPVRVSRAPTMVLGGLQGRRQKKRVESKAYDYIIVGGGTAGCVLANRLSADPSKSVLVVEAGSAPPDNILVKVPVAVLKLFRSKWDWDFATEPADHLDARSLYLCRGKGLGGSSCTNVMLYTRGSEADYDAWAAECDDASWKGSAMLEYFKRAEKCLSTENSGVGKWHGDDGPAAVSDVPYQNPLSKAFLEATKEAGFSENADFNDWSREQVGFGRFQVSQRRGVRESAASAYLGSKVRRRPNLDIVTGATVTKIAFDGREAKSVDFALRDRNVTAALSDNAASEIIVTAGAIGSPQVLMLSGVGPASELAEHDIPVVVDLGGVGKNMQDHPACLVSRYSTKDAPKSHSTSLRIPGTTATNPVAAVRWLARKDGPLTSPGCDHGGFLRLSPDASTHESDVQLRFLATKSITPDGMSTIANDYKATRNHPDGFTVQTILARPKSKDGTVTLASNDPFQKPKITGAYLSDQDDVDTMVAALKRARDILAQPALSKYAADEEFPGPDVFTDDALAAYAKRTVHTANAIVGTCKLGTPSDPLAVVDNQLKVIGTTCLRVCDSSIMPVLPGGQTGSSTIAIAEKAADLLLNMESSSSSSTKDQKVAA
ncbi:hypothetical protein CTAYLR_004925 [Chrysophaeum taylorii]|uniref:Glucose-methanol-choline oxidoreductase N-terminal domain-containing protein n=1 Tax=Chrysophaeum taylorii TaxID=2483200 RepID=A0AAD7XRV5_9STRA|nr:hypothetical protein CTAYLR_004925 [Chrysophaeum taylorii]